LARIHASRREPLGTDRVDRWASTHSARISSRSRGGTLSRCRSTAGPARRRAPRLPRPLERREIREHLLHGHIGVDVHRHTVLARGKHVQDEPRNQRDMVGPGLRAAGPRSPLTSRWSIAAPRGKVSGREQSTKPWLHGVALQRHRMAA
jgi:hypothetical protein